MAELLPNWDKARASKTEDFFESLITKLLPLVQNFNRNFEDPIMWLRRPQSLLLYRRDSYVKVILEGSGAIRIAFGYRDVTGALVYPHYNRMMLDTNNRWVLYRYQNGSRTRLQGVYPEPARMARVLVSRLAEISAMAPDLIPVLSL